MRTFISFLSVAWLLTWSPARADEISIHQDEIDAAYELIFQTQLGKAICRQILGARPQALTFHLGVSRASALRIAGRCPPTASHPWIYPTRPEDIRKITLKGPQPRKFGVLVSQTTFPIESWTDPFTNTTILVTPTLPIPHDRWVQILAHEMAVYFDSKVNPAHPDADQIPELYNLNILFGGKLNPLVAVSNPLHGHALTFLRGLAVESEILSELLRGKRIRVAEPLSDPFQKRLASDQCGHECIRDLMLRLRTTLMPMSLPLLAFAPHYRSLILSELPRLNLQWTDETWQKARLVLNRLPVTFLSTEFAGDPLVAMKKIFYANLEEYERFKDIVEFLDLDLWPIEKKALFSAAVGSRNLSFVEYMKRPLLSGYNIGLSSGPRVRIRTGNVE